MWPGGWSRTRTVSWKHGFSSLLSPCTAECSWQLICSPSFSFLIHKMIRWHLSSSCPTHQKYFARLEQLPLIIYQNIEEKEAATANQYICMLCWWEIRRDLIQNKNEYFHIWQAAWIKQLKARAMGKTRSIQLGIYWIVSCSAQQNAGPVINPCLWSSQQIYA